MVEKNVIDNNFLRSLDAEEREKLLSYAEERVYSAGETIFFAGDGGNGLFVINQGEVAITLDSPDAKTLTLNVYAAGDIFGELAALDRFARSANAVARTSVKLLFVDSDSFRMCLRQNPNIAMKLILVLTHRIRRTSSILWDTSFLGARQRVARRLIEAIQAKPKVEPAGQNISIEISQDELSHLCGISRESVNKVLSGMQKAGIVSTMRKRTIIHDSAALEKLADIYYPI